MRFLFAPGDIPSGARLGIFQDGRYADLLRDILLTVRPDIDVSGFTTGLEASGDGLVLVVTPYWARVLAAYDGDTDHILVMPVPEGDYWAYWEFSRRVLSEKGGFGRLSDDDLSRILGPEEGDTTWTRHYLRFQPAVLQEYFNRIAFVLEKLEDEESTRIYNRLLTGTPEEYWRAYAEETYDSLQYFDRDLVTLREGDVVIDGGVQQGFEVPLFVAEVGKTGKVVCVDPYGFDSLFPYVRETMACFPETVVERPLALWSETKPITLYAGDGEQVCGLEPPPGTPEEKCETFPAVTVDDLVSDLGLDRVDLIKMDLEGAEPHATVGMVETLRAHRPQLAISIYHCINHFWDIPIYLMGKCENYAFFIRSYSSQMEETILYAIPQERLKPRG